MEVRVILLAVAIGRDDGQDAPPVCTYGALGSHQYYPPELLSSVLGSATI